MPWERQPDEPPKAFAAFQTYRDQPPMERSLRRLALLLGRSRQHIADWSSRYRWVERVAAWDAEQDRLLRVQLAHEREAFARRLAAAGALLQVKGIGKIRTFVDRVDRDGHEVQLLPGQRFTEDMTVSEAVRLIEVGARLETQGRGLPAAPEPGGDAATFTPNPIIEALTIDPSRITEALAKMQELAAILELEGVSGHRVFRTE